MKTPLSLLAASLCAAVATAPAAGPTIPQRPPPETFQKLTEDWPFALATPAAPVAAPVAPWSSNYYVSGIGKSYLSGAEEIFVAIKKKDGTGAFSLFGNQPNKEEDIAIGGIEWSATVGKSKVTLKKGTEFATIEFDQAVTQPAAQQVPGQLRPGMPNLPPGVKQPMIRPPGAAVPRPTNIPQPMPHGNTVPLPGPSNTNSATINPSPNVPNAPNTANPPKQRVRVIQSTP